MTMTYRVCIGSIVPRNIGFECQEMSSWGETALPSTVSLMERRVSHCYCPSETKVRSLWIHVTQSFRISIALSKGVVRAYFMTPYSLP